MAACGARLVARLHCLAVPCLPVPPPNPFASRVGVREGRVAVSMPHMQSAAGSRSYEISNSRRVNCSHAAEENEERIGLGHVRWLLLGLAGMKEDETGLKRSPALHVASRLQSGRQAAPLRPESPHLTNGISREKGSKVKSRLVSDWEKHALLQTWNIHMYVYTRHVFRGGVAHQIAELLNLRGQQDASQKCRFGLLCIN